ncbi:hypothetical protein IWQ60_008989 [Tieghemiomyces parasiticus]|uniref:Uncharacterized protein n=1 Tax=Tieghemiomyces parasiticus TaxID=78921 RepID=A0A9W7ZZD9_9FUNG|nr:hypothetical protein IWQ60_008989 [Tieghemiomyces parasiticus]
MHPLQSRSLRFAPDVDKENATTLFSPARVPGAQTPGHRGKQHLKPHGSTLKPLAQTKSALVPKTPLMAKSVPQQLQPLTVKANTTGNKDGGMVVKPGAKGVKMADIHTPCAKSVLRPQPAKASRPTVTQTRPKMATSPALDTQQVWSTNLVNPATGVSLDDDFNWEPEWMPPAVEEPDFDPEVEVDWAFLARPPPASFYEAAWATTISPPPLGFEPETIPVSHEGLDDLSISDPSLPASLDEASSPVGLGFSSGFSLIPTRAPSVVRPAATRSPLRSRRRLSYRPSRLRPPTNWRLKAKVAASPSLSVPSARLT